MKLIDIVVPCYNEEENVRDFYDEFIRDELTNEFIPKKFAFFRKKVNNH